jgi:hypothetical protein
MTARRKPLPLSDGEGPHMLTPAERRRLDIALEALRADPARMAEIDRVAKIPLRPDQKRILRYLLAREPLRPEQERELAFLRRDVST